MSDLMSITEAFHWVAIRPEVAKNLNWEGRKTVREWCRKGIIPAFKHKGRWRIYKSGFEEFVSCK